MLYAMKTCKDLAKLIDFSCCISCHEDDDDWGYDMFEIEFQNEEYYVCCAGANAVEDENPPLLGEKNGR